MKALPGIKIVGFVMVVLTVAFGVYAGTQHKPESSPAQPNVVVKFGPSGPLEKLSYATALRIIKRFQKDSTLYVVQHLRREMSRLRTRVIETRNRVLD